MFIISGVMTSVGQSEVWEPATRAPQAPSTETVNTKRCQRHKTNAGKNVQESTVMKRYNIFKCADRQ